MKSGHVSMWHVWNDKPGQRHALELFEKYSSLETEKIIEHLGTGVYAFCNDILGGNEVHSDLLLHDRTEAYLSRTGNIAALRVRGKRKSGFIIPAIQWLKDVEPDKEFLSAIDSIFKLFHFEAITPSSLSEKVLRSTLPEHITISRPSVMLRRCLINNTLGGRQEFTPTKGKLKKAYEYDKIKAYLSIAASGVPAPFSSPYGFHGCRNWNPDLISWMQVTLKAYGSGLQPIQLRNEHGVLYSPKDQETFTCWLWSFTFQDCLDSGYKIIDIHQGYTWYYLSDFMAKWADILFNAYEKCNDEYQKSIIKSMAVAFPGRCLKQPEIYSLVHKSNWKQGDIPLPKIWSKGESPISSWYMRVDSESEEARESTALTHIGSYIIEKCRSLMFQAAKKEEKRGNKVLRIYVDSITLQNESKDIKVGKSLGEFKVNEIYDVKVGTSYIRAKNNIGETILKAQGITGDERKKLHELD